MGEVGQYYGRSGTVLWEKWDSTMGEVGQPREKWDSTVGEVGQSREKWDSTMREVGQPREKWDNTMGEVDSIVGEVGQYYGRSGTVL